MGKSNDSYSWTGHNNVNRPYTSNGLNQLTTAGATALGYDGRGNLTTSGTSTYTYTSENRLATAPGGYVMTYDPLGRYHWIANAGTIWMQYDGGNIIEERNETGVLKRYVYGPGDDAPIVWYEGSGTADKRYLMADERGSITGVTSNTGALLALNSYDEYGIPAATNIGRFGYTGQAWIPELGMNYYKARIYSPTLGRFMQTDPIGYGDGMNLYNYVANDPINFADPSGLMAEPCPADTIRANGVKQRETFDFGALTNDFGSVYIPGSGGGGGGGTIVVTAKKDNKAQKKPQSEPVGPTRDRANCAAALREDGKIVVGLLSGTVATVGGLTGSVGVFRNLKTGTTGRFVTVGAVIGIESGGTITGGHFESLASLVGAAQLNSLTIGFLNGSASFDLDGNFIG